MVIAAAVAIALGSLLNGAAASVVTNAGDSGAGSLRSEIAAAPAGGTLSFDPALSGATITLVTGELSIGKDLTIDASALQDGVVLSSNGTSRVISISAGAIVTLDSLTITNGSASGITFPAAAGGGIFNDGGDLTITECTVSDNTAAGDGGGIYNAGGTLTITASTVSDNTAEASGGGLFNVGGNATLSLSAISGNSAASDGGAIHNHGGTLAVTRSTLSGNSANNDGGAIYSDTDLIGITTSVAGSTLTGNAATSGHGGAIYNHDGRTEITACTIAGNTAPAGTSGGGVGSFGDNATETIVLTSIIAGNTGSDLDFTSLALNNSYTSAGHNLIGFGNAGGDFNQPGDLTDVADPRVSPLADHGGPVPTMHPMADSPAIDAGGGSDPGGSDQRGFPRFVNGALDIGAVEAGPAQLVSNTSDSGAGSLRQALLDATPTQGARILFDPAVFPATIDLAAELLIAGGIVFIDASDIPGGVDLDANRNSRVLTVQGTTTIASIQSLSITGGAATGATLPDNGGAGIFNDGATLAIFDTTVTDNMASGSGGGILNEGLLAVVDSTISDNVADDSGGGILNGAGGTATVAGSTITGNYAGGGDGGGISNNGLLTATNCGISNNTVGTAGGAGGAISSTGTLVVTDSTLAGNTAASNGGGIHGSGGSVSISGSTISDNTADIDGGGIYNDGTLSVVNTGLVDNIAMASSGAGGGGAIFNAGGTLDILDSTVAGNSSEESGGGIYNAGGGLALAYSTLSDNSSGSHGGGIYSDTDLAGTTTQLTACTLCKNSVPGLGGGIYNSDGRLLITSCTITENSAPSDKGSGVASHGSLTTDTVVVASIIAGNTGNDTDFTTDATHNSFTSSGYNLIGFGNAVGDFDQAGDTTGTSEPDLSALAYFGGPTQTMHPLIGSPAIDAGGSTDPGGTDQRGLPRFVNGALDIGSVEAGPVRMITKANDAGSGSLRQVLLDAAAVPGARIRFDPTVFPATIPLASSLSIAGGQSAFIDASDIPDGTTLDAGLASRILSVQGGTTAVALHSLTLTGGTTTGSGGAVLNQDATLTLINSTVADSTADIDGGGIYNDMGKVTLVDSTVTRNSAGESGGGIATNGGLVIVIDSVLSHNPAVVHGGGIYNQGGDILVAEDSILGGNSAAFGAGIGNFDGSLTIDGSKVVNHSSATDGGALYNDSGSAIITDSTFSFNTVTGDGGAIANASGGSVIVNDSTLDNNSAVGNAGAILNQSGGVLTLVASTLLTNTARNGGGVANFGSLTVNNSTLTDNHAVADGPSTGGGGAIYNTSLLSVTGSTISGNSADGIDGGGGGIFNDDGTLTLSTSKLADNSATHLGGGLRHILGSVTVTGTTFEDNSADEGGAIHNVGVTNRGGSLTVIQSTFSANSSVQDGGAVYTDTELAGVITKVLNSTFTANTTASGRGAAIRNADGRTEVISCTISGNTAPDGAGSGIASAGNSTTETLVQMSIISGNTGSDIDFTDEDIINSFDSGGSNLIGLGNATGAFGDPGDTTGITDPHLSPLADFGGPTLTLHPLTGSPVIDTGGTIDPGGTDQRGFSRFVNGTLDIGAVEAGAIQLVTSTSDSGPGTLRQALLDAVDNPGIRLRFDAAVFPATIQINSELIIGDGAMFIDASDITGGVTVDAGGNSRIFNLQGASSTLAIHSLVLTAGSTIESGGAIHNDGGTLTLNYTTIGGSSASEGGAIYNALGTVIVNNSTFTGNSTETGNGGAIYNDEGLALIKYSAFSNNTAACNGGAVFNEDSFMLIVNTDFVQNHADFSGGGVHQHFGELKIDDCAFTDNSTAHHGGGISNGVGTLVVCGSALSGNTATGRGGGLNSSGGLLTIDGSSVTGNTANMLGGGIFSGGSLQIVDSIVNGNSAATDGGGIYNFVSSSDLTNSTLAENHGLGGDGGAIHNTGTLDIVNCTIAENEAAGRGGGIDNLHGSLSISSSTLAGNSSGESGGGISQAPSATAFTVENTIVATNLAYDSGPDINGMATGTAGVNLIGNPSDAAGLGATGTDYLVGDPLLSPLSDFGGPTRTLHPLAGSPAIDAAGTTDPGGTDQRGFARFINGALDIGAVEAGTTELVTSTNDSGPGSLRQAILDAAPAPGTLVQFDSAVFPATIDLAGELLVDGGRTVFIDASGIPGGVTVNANQNGRAFKVDGSGTVLGLHSLTLTGGWATGGAPGENAGGAILNQGATLLVTRCTISDNTADEEGGGVHSDGGSTIITNSTLDLNTALSGGAISAHAGSLAIVNSTIFDNSAGQGGGGIYSLDASMAVIHSTLGRNSAGTTGGGILDASASPDFTLGNTIVADNTAGTSGPEIGGGPSVIEGVNFIGDPAGTGGLGTPGTDYLTGDPQLAPLAYFGESTRTAPPLLGSPVIEAAVPQKSTPASDQRGGPRPNGPSPDIGAVEAFPFSTLPLVDTDGDGIDDRIEEPYPQFTVGIDDSQIDSDGDGHTDAVELANMTDLNDPTEWFRILSIAKAPGFDPALPRFIVTLPTFPGLDYEFETNPALGGTFTPFPGSAFTANDFTTAFEILLVPPDRFLRVKRK